MQPQSIHKENIQKQSSEKTAIHGRMLSTQPSDDDYTEKDHIRHGTRYGKQRKYTALQHETQKEKQSAGSPKNQGKTACGKFCGNCG